MWSFTDKPSFFVFSIIEATGAGSYHGFLPMMVRNCINSLTSSTPDASQQYPLPLATALFSFLYHLASYELGGEALVNCGMLESLLKVVNWETSDVEYITVSGNRCIWHLPSANSAILLLVWGFLVMVQKLCCSEF